MIPIRLENALAMKQDLVTEEMMKCATEGNRYVPLT